MHASYSQSDYQQMPSMQMQMPLPYTQHQSLLSQSHDQHTPTINIMELDQMQTDIYQEEKTAQTAFHFHNNNNKKIQLHHFNNDIRAYNVWIACKHSDESDFIFFNTLYPKCCQYFADIVGSNRYPTYHELQHVMIKHGAMTSNNQYLCVNRLHFM